MEVDTIHKWHVKYVMRNRMNRKWHKIPQNMPMKVKHYDIKLSIRWIQCVYRRRWDNVTIIKFHIWKLFNAVWPFKSFMMYSKVIDFDRIDSWFGSDAIIHHIVPGTRYNAPFCNSFLLCINEPITLLARIRKPMLIPNCHFFKTTYSPIRAPGNTAQQNAKRHSFSP